MDQVSTTDATQDATSGTSTDTGTGTEAETQTQASDATDQGQKNFDLAYVEKLRKEAASSRTKNKDMQAQIDALTASLKAREDAELSDQQKIVKERDALAKQLKAANEAASRRSLDYEAVVLANRLNIVDPDAAVRLLDRSDIEWDEAGNPTNLQTLMEALIDKKPYLKGKTKQEVPDLGASNSARTSGRTDSKGAALTLEEVTSMSPAEQAKRWPEVAAFLKNYRKK